MSTPEWHAIQAHKKEILSKISDLSGTVIAGNCKTFEDYKAKTAEIRAYADGLARLDETIKTYIEDDDD